MHSLFALPGQFLEDGPARRIGKRAEHGIGIGRFHIETITKRLCFVKHETKAASQNKILRLLTTSLDYFAAPFAMSPVVEKPSTVGTIFTCPPQLSTSFAPTIVSGL
jgi:hypothetical protein